MPTDTRPAPSPSGLAPETQGSVGRRRRVDAWRRSRADLSAAVLCLALALALQWLAGMAVNEFGAHPDEGAHYVTGLMVGDYLASGLPGNPMRFALQYYAHYPAVGLGNWPPVFYGIEAIWAAVFGDGRVVSLALIALCATALATLGGRVVRERDGALAGLLAGVFLLLAGPVRVQLGIVSPELLVSALMLGAAIAFARFVDSPTIFRGALFGAVAAVAILTKGNALALGLVPALIIVIDRRWDLLRRAGLWVSAIVVVLLAGPWQALTFQYARQSWSDTVGWEFTSKAAPFFLRETAASLGIVVVLISCVGFARMAFTWRTLPTVWRTTAALAVAVFTFHSVVPASLEVRYMVSAIPAVVLGVFAAVRWTAEMFARRIDNPNRVVGAVGLALCVLALVQPVRRPDVSGIGLAADAALSIAGDRPFALLVSSRNMKEVAMVAEVAQRERSRPRNYVIRGLRGLGDTDWMGHDYVAKVRSEAELRAYLDSIPIAFVVVDTTAGPLEIPHHEPLSGYLGANTGDWVPVPFGAQQGATATPAGRNVVLYRRAVWRDMVHPPASQGPRGMSAGGG